LSRAALASLRAYEIALEFGDVSLPSALIAFASSRRWPSRGKPSRIRRRAKPSLERQRSGRRSRLARSRKSCGKAAGTPKPLQQS